MMIVTNFIGKNIYYYHIIVLSYIVVHYSLAQLVDSIDLLCTRRSRDWTHFLLLPRVDVGSSTPPRGD
jgi:hypothetical protein